MGSVWGSRKLRHGLISSEAGRMPSILQQDGKEESLGESSAGAFLGSAHLTETCSAGSGSYWSI